MKPRDYASALTRIGFGKQPELEWPVPGSLVERTRMLRAWIQHQVSYGIRIELKKSQALRTVADLAGALHLYPGALGRKLRGEVAAGDDELLAWCAAFDRVDLLTDLWARVARSEFPPAPANDQGVRDKLQLRLSASD